MERLLKDATKLTGVKYDINNLADIYEAVHAIQEEIGITGTTALEAEETIEGSLNAMKSAFTNTLGALAIGENVGESFKALAETASVFLFENLIPMLGTIISQLPTAISTFVQTAAPLIMENGRELIGNLIEAITGALSTPIDFEGLTFQFSEMFADLIFDIGNRIPEFLEKGKEFVVSLASGVFENIPYIIDMTGSMVDSVIRWIGEFLPEFLQTGADMLIELVNGFVDNLPAMAESITGMANLIFAAIEEYLPVLLEKGFEIITNIAKGIWNNLPKIVSTMGDLLSSLISLVIQYFPRFIKQGVELIGKFAIGIWNNLPQIITTLGNLLGKLVGKIAQHFPEFIRKGFELIIQLGDGLIKSIPNIVAKIPQIISALLNTFGKLAGQFKNIGKDIIRGLWEGILSVKDWILGKIKGFVGSVTDGIKSFFGIKSPSKVMANEVGKWLPMGLADGIEKNANPVSQAMEDLAEEAVSSFDIGNLVSDVSVSSGKLAYTTAGTGSGGIALNFYPQNMTEADLEMAFNYVNRRFGMGV